MKVGSSGPRIPSQGPEPTAGKPETSGVDKPAGESKFSEVARTNAAVATTGTAAAEKPAAAAPNTPLTGDIGRKLENKEITVQTAVDQVVSRILDKQVGNSAPAGARTAVETALRAALEDDPLLNEKLKTLDR